MRQRLHLFAYNFNCNGCFDVAVAFNNCLISTLPLDRVCTYNGNVLAINIVSEGNERLSNLNIADTAEYFTL